jgi:hypothetical protein
LLSVIVQFIAPGLDFPKFGVAAAAHQEIREVTPDLAIHNEFDFDWLFGKRRDRRVCVEQTHGRQFMR